MRIQTLLRPRSFRQGARHRCTQERAQPAWRGQAVAQAQQSESTGCARLLRRAGMSDLGERTEGGIHANSTLQLPPGPRQQKV